MFGTVPEPEGITSPPIDNLLEKVESKYALSVYAAQRARQINSYRQEMTRGDGNITTFGPLVEASPDDKPLSIALNEIGEGRVEWGAESE
ncbi:MAG: DNA-directed RNA polymerase subunit omega [Actinomycetaceae bacterium]|nr:DNA-directed RNA polymerase subunit omega [Actinomycetaceae bacterium]